MSHAVNQIARKDYEDCSRCQQPIRKGEEYYKRMEGAKVHGMTSYSAHRWHVECPKATEGLP